MLPMEEFSMDTFREKMEAMAKMSSQDRMKAVEDLKAQCICPTCPTYNNCAKNANEKLFCTLGNSFMCISFEKTCICPTCPVASDMGLHYKNFCTRGSEKAQRFEHTVWGSTMVKK
jgi:hypothetical protein